jgi:hypothetical protein
MNKTHPAINNHTMAMPHYPHATIITTKQHLILEKKSGQGTGLNNSSINSSSP